MKTLAKIALATTMFFGMLTMSNAQHQRGNSHNEGQREAPNHQVYTPRGVYDHNARDGGRFANRSGMYRGRPYYGGLRIYRGINIFPCNDYDFINGLCYPYDYYYYPQLYNGFGVGINIR